MSKFNAGKAYHGSADVTNGKLTGATDTDYFYFFCPKCEGREILRLLDYDLRAEQPINPYDDQLSSKAASGFTFAFKVHCERCGLTDFVKLSNLHWQGGQLQESQS
ncbi:hypothetical protein BGP82_26525 [Pseudomonas putida]|uniref:Uncharacterized protein n=1 Tax=Pseudomonas putida TaxID=303 RepID=A0A2S3WMF9_PSEPU|nr:hypothetical protein [Pseudomonas putida]POG01004.1 hypothetical protein BGP82_26525 [Pseudomonas putida]